jgi:hypothetical protein
MQEDKKKVYLRSFGWPLVQVPQDDFMGIKEVKWLSIRELGKI